MAWERMIARSLVVGIGIEQRDALAQEVIGILEFTPRRVVIVVALRVHDSHADAETAAITLLITREARAGIAEDVVQVVAQWIVEEPHARIRVFTEAGRLTEMFAEDERVVAGEFAVEIGVALVGVRVAVRQVELKLRLPHVARRVLILVRPALQPEEITGNMLHGIEAQTIAFRLVDQVTDGANDRGVNVFAKGVGVGAQVDLRDIAKAHADSQRIEIVVFGAVRMPHVERLGCRAAFRRTEIRVGALMRHIHQADERTVLDLPDIVVVRDVVPVPVEATCNRLQVEIGRDSSRKQSRRHAGVVARHVGCPVVHHVVEIDPQPKTMGHRYHPLQFILCSVTRGSNAPLVLVAEVERIKEIVADREAAIALGRRREPQARVTRLSDLGQLLADLIP